MTRFVSNPHWVISCLAITMAVAPQLGCCCQGFLLRGDWSLGLSHPEGYTAGGPAYYGVGHQHGPAMYNGPGSFHPVPTRPVFKPPQPELQTPDPQKVLTAPAEAIEVPGELVLPPAGSTTRRSPQGRPGRASRIARARHSTAPKVAKTASRRTIRRSQQPNVLVAATSQAGDLDAWQSTHDPPPTVPKSLKSVVVRRSAQPAQHPDPTRWVQRSQRPAWRPVRSRP